MREWPPHSFEKISILSDYLRTFTKASERAVNRVYLDAFAGDTINVLKGSDRAFPGSAEVALSVSPPFTHVRLFELQRDRADRLETLLIQFPDRDARVVRGNCNETIAAVLPELPVAAPTFAFLDPDGMELHWSTIERIADHKRSVYDEGSARSKVEMWILVPTSGIVRMLGTNRGHAEAQGFPEKIVRLYGAWGPWQTVWEARLDGRITGGQAKQAYLFLYMDRLAQLGYRYLLVRPIENSRNELYAMVFATDHPAGASIMRWAQEQDRVRPRSGTLFDVAEARPPYEDLHTGWREEFPIQLPPWEELT